MAEAKAKNELFEWEGKDQKGQKVKGQTQGPNADWVKAQLRRKGTIPLRVRKKKASRSSRGKKVDAADIAIFSRQLSTMLSSGVPLVQSFDIIAQGSEKQQMRELVTAIKTDIESGTNLSQALAKHPKYFDDLYCNLVAAGEQSGTLENLLDKIAVYKEKTEALKSKIRKAATYPAAIVVVAFVVTAILLIFVIPQFENLFATMGGDLPVFTRMVVDMSEFFQAYWYLIFGGLGIAGFLGFKMYKTSRPFREAVEKLTLKLPVFGNIAHKAAIARFARTLSTMSAAGVPLVEAMDSVARTAGNVVYQQAIERMRDDATTGTQLNVSMESQQLFPNMVVQMTAIGEESGSLDGMLGKVADFYEAEVDGLVESLTSLMEPIIISVLGIVIGGLVIAMYLPVFQMGMAIG